VKIQEKRKIEKHSIACHKQKEKKGENRERNNGFDKHEK